MDAILRLDHELVALEAEDAVFGLLELRAPEPPALEKRPKLGLALVIDRSGSMAGDKLEVAKACAGFLAGRLTSEDRLGVVAYDDQVSLVSGLHGPDPDLRHAIERIHPGGSTNLSGGWLKGVEVLEGIEADVRRVLLLTDGLANVGIQDSNQLASMSASAAERGITTSTIGFGEGFDEELLSAMADSGRGHDYFAASPEEAPSIFAQEFEGLSSLVAQNLSVEIRMMQPGVDVAILNEYPITPNDGGLQAALGDVFGGEVRKMVFKVIVPGLAERGRLQVAEVIIRWAEIAGEAVKLHTRTIPVTINAVPHTEAEAGSADPAVTEEVVILEAARARKDARSLADRGDFDGARRLLAEKAAELRAIAPDSPRAAAAADDIEELERFDRRMEQRLYDQTDSKMRWEQSRRRHRSQDYRKRPDRP